MISSELATFLESGTTVLFGARAGDLMPDCGRGFGARVEAGGRELTVFLPAATAETTIADLRDNGRLAVCITRPLDHHSIQLKGRVLEVRDADESDRACIERYRAALIDTLSFLGVPPRLLERMSHWPCHAVRMAVEAVFVQTPGPGAGAPLGATTGRSDR